MSLMDGMMDRMLEKMTKEEKVEMMESMMGKFFEGFTPVEKQDLMLKIMPKMMEGMDLTQMMPMMMFQMMGGMREGEGATMNGAVEDTHQIIGDKPFKPWKMCEKMVGGMKEMVETNKAILEELRRHPSRRDSEQ